MASPMKHNPAAHDPAVIYWDWEKTKIVNRPPGLPGPQRSPWDKHSIRQKQSRAGTLKRSNAFIGDEYPHLARGYHRPLTNKTDMTKVDVSKLKPDAKFGFPESLYSEAKRRAVEDMGNRFMHTIQKLDKGGLKEPIDFNFVLERHWAELAEFYSVQVSIIRNLERKLKNAASDIPRDPPTNLPPQIPPYLMSQLSDMELRPFAFKDSEKNSDSASRPGCKENELADEDSNTRPLENETTNIAAGSDVGGHNVRKINNKTQAPINQDNKKTLWEKKVDVVSKNPRILENIYGENNDGMIRYKFIRDEQPVQGSEMEITSEEIHRDLNSEFTCAATAESATKLQPELNLCILEKPGAEENPVKHHGAADFEVTAGMRQFNHSSVSNCLGKDKNNTQGNDTQRTNNQRPVDPRETSVTYPIANTLIETHYEAHAGVMKLTIMNLRDIDDTNSTPSERGPEADADEQIKQCSFTDDISDDNNESTHRPNISNIKNSTPKPLLDAEDVIGDNCLSKVESPTDASYGTITCTPEEIILDEIDVPPLSPTHHIVPIQTHKAAKEIGSEIFSNTTVVESALHDSSNDAFSVSDDSHLFCGSTKYELENLQIEVEDHLEQAKKNGGLLVARWIDESGIRRESRVTVNVLDNEARLSKAIKNKEEDEEAGVGGGGDSEEYENECEDVDMGDDAEGEIIEVYEVEYLGDADKGNEDEDDEIDEEMEKILAWIAHEDAKIEADAKLKDKGYNPTEIDSDKNRIKEILDTADSDYEKEGGRDTIATHAVVEKVLSTVNEELDGEVGENDDQEGDKKDAGIKREGEGEGEGREKEEGEESGTVIEEEYNDESSEFSTGTEKGNEDIEKRATGDAKGGDTKTICMDEEEGIEKDMRANGKSKGEHEKNAIRMEA